MPRLSTMPTKHLETLPDSLPLSPEQSNGIYLASGRVHPELGQAISNVMGVPLSPVEIRDHPNSEIYVRFEESVRAKHVIIVQSHHAVDGRSINDALQENYMMVQAAVDASADEVTVVAPYLAYSRSDRKARGRESTGAKLVLRTLGAIGVKRMLSVDLHSPQTTGMFDGLYDHLIVQPQLRAAIRDYMDSGDLDAYAVVAPDLGHSKSAEKHAEFLDIDLITMQKKRDRLNSSRVMHTENIPEAKDRVIFMFDDMIDTAGTAVSAIEKLYNSGAKEIYYAATHAILSEPALERLSDPDLPINKIIVSDTLPTQLPEDELGNRLRVVSSAPVIGRALKSIIRKESVSEIFDDLNHM